jgi:hypothetical protein
MAGAPVNRSTATQCQPLRLRPLPPPHGDTEVGGRRRGIIDAITNHRRAAHVGQDNQRLLVRSKFGPNGVNGKSFGNHSATSRRSHGENNPFDAKLPKIAQQRFCFSAQRVTKNQDARELTIYSRG